MGSDASHAWCAAWCPRFGWVDFDPTNNCVPSDGHITLAWGRDYSDVSPIRGVLLGGAKTQPEGGRGCHAVGVTCPDTTLRVPLSSRTLARVGWDAPCSSLHLQQMTGAPHPGISVKLVALRPHAAFRMNAATPWMLLESRVRKYPRYLAKNERDVGHPSFVRSGCSFRTASTTGSGPRRAKLEITRLKKATGENSPREKNESEV